MWEPALEPWAVPEKDLLKVYVLGEIVSASNFGDNLYVEYFVGCEDKWRLLNNHPMTGVTQISLKPFGCNTAHFGYPMEMQFESETGGKNFLLLRVLNWK
jgi:hypothetical protein